MNAGPVRICHFIPSDGVGGVETAARFAASETRDVRIVFAGAGQPALTPARSRGVRALRALREVFGLGALRGAAESADIAVFSLWKTSLLFFAWKIVIRKPAVLFIHCEKPFHLIDRLTTLCAMLAADAILTDSDTTAHARVPHWILERKSVQSVSMLLGHYPASDFGASRVAARFAFWGRLAEQKRVDRALHLMAALKAAGTKVDFVLIGPDDGELENCRRLVNRLDLGSEVSFLGPMPREAIFGEVERATFFVQLSDFEGFGMSVAEAMRQGLIPIVTPVGDVGRYCVHMQNAIVFRDEISTVADVIHMLGDAPLRTQLSEAARRTWERAPTYTEDFVAKITEIYRNRPSR